MSTTTPTPAPAATPSRPRRARTAAIATVGVLAGLGAAYGAGYALTGNGVPANTTIGGVAVGGRSAADADVALRAAFSAAESGAVILKAGDATLEKTPADLGLGIDYAASIANSGATKTLNPVEMVNRLIGGRTVPLVITTDATKLGTQLSALAASEATPKDATLTFEGTTPKVTPAVPGQALQSAGAADALAKAWPASSTVELPVTETEADITTAEAAATLDSVAKPAVAAPVTVKAGDKSFELAPEAIAPALTFKPTGGVLAPVLDPAKLTAGASEQLGKLGAKAPVDAAVRIGSDGKPHVVEGSDGFGVAPADLAAAVLPALPKASDRVATVTLSTVKPSFDTEAATALGIKEVTGEFTTTFSGTYAYRYVNIPKAAGMLNNMVIKPGETFSMNEALGGERTVAKGWAAGFGIMNGKENIQVGGALSQVTTTTFNAVYFAGLEDIYHKPHSLYFSRYPKGREATLDYPGVDLKFRNDSPYGVLIQATTTGHVGVSGSITVKIWSTKQYDVKQANIKISNVKDMSNVTPTPDDSADCVAQDALTGFDINYDRQWWADGKLVKSVPYFWHYNTLTPTVCTNPVALAAEQARRAAAGG